MNKIRLIRLILAGTMIFLAVLTLELHFIAWIDPYGRIIPYILFALLPIHVALAVLDQSSRQQFPRQIKITRVKHSEEAAPSLEREVKFDLKKLRRLIELEREEEEELVEV